MKTHRPIVITGFMGCGKTGVARQLAYRLNLAMVDLDDAITEQAGRSPARLIAEDGEKVFRAVESNTLRDLLRAGEGGVIALGGGAWIEDINRELINQHRGLSVWLDAPFDLCWERIGASGDDRPLGKTKEQALALYERRRPVYQLASISIEVKATESLDVLASRIEAEVKNHEF